MLVRTHFSALAAFAVFSFYLFLVYSILAPFLAALAWAAIFAITTFPLFVRLRSRLRGRGELASALMTPIVVILLALPILVTLFFLLAEIDGLLEQMEVRMAAGDFATSEGLQDIPGLSPLLEYLQPLLEDFNIDLRETVAPALQNLVADVVEQTKNIAQISLAVGIGFFLMCISLFFFYRDGERILDLLWSIIPLPDGQKTLLAETVKNVLSAVLYGVFLTAVIQGSIAFIGYFLAGLPSPVLLGALTVIAALIPGLGTALVWAPAGIYLLVSGDISPGIFLLLWGGLVVATTDNFIRPYFISGRGHLPFLTVLLGILGGLAAFGLIGIVLGPIILALFFTILRIYGGLLPSGVAAHAHDQSPTDAGT